MVDDRVNITELIELYRDMPCIWDFSCDEYKDKNVKRKAWETLVSKWKTVDPAANEASVKQKLENLKASFKRELRKVKESKLRSTSTSGGVVHTPSLWYFHLLTFLDPDGRRWPVTLSSDNETPVMRNRKKRRHTVMEYNKHKPVEAAQHKEERKKNTSSFAVYVGEQLDSLSTNQRQIAEKLISEVLFLGKTDNLNFHSKVEINKPNRLKYFCTFDNNLDASKYPSRQSPDSIPAIKKSPSENDMLTEHSDVSSPQYRIASPQFTVDSPQRPSEQDMRSTAKSDTFKSESNLNSLSPTSPIYDKTHLLTENSSSSHEPQEENVESKQKITIEESNEGNSSKSSQATLLLKELLLKT